MDALAKQLAEDVQGLRNRIQRHASERATGRKDAGKPNEAERRAAEAEGYISSPLPDPSPEERADLETNLRDLAAEVRAPEETDEQALERVRASRYVTRMVADPHWPFFDAEHRADRVLLTVNTQHPFYANVYAPLEAMDAPDDGDHPLVGLQMTLLSLARTQISLSGASNENQRLFKSMRDQWSIALKEQMQG